MKKIKLIVASSISVAILTACGGGGGDAPAATAAQATTSFPLQSGYKARIAGGSSENFNITGDCSGTAAIATAKPISASFEGTSGLSTTTTATINFTNCTPASNAVTSTAFFDTNYNPLGSSIAGVEYGKFLTVPDALPTSVKVGDTAVFGTETIYTDSTKQVSTGQRIRSYVIEADTASTAIANLITKGFNASNQLLFTQQSRYRMAADGTLTISSLDVQYSTTSANHFVYTSK